MVGKASHAGIWWYQVSQQDVLRYPHQLLFGLLPSTRSDRKDFDSGAVFLLEP